VYTTFVVFLVTYGRAKERLDPTRELLSACPRYADLDFQFTNVLIHISRTELSWLLVIPCPIIAILIHFVSGPGVSSLCCAGLTGGATYYLVEMQRKRQIIRDIAGQEFEDDQWGFGQVLAIFIWIPVCVAMTSVVFRVSGSYERSCDLQERS
jgi:hypothetical protein